MLKIPLIGTVLTLGTFFIAVGLVGYRLLWAASQVSGAGVLPKRLRSLRRWLHGEPSHNKP